MVRRTKCRQIYEKPLLPTRPHGQNGKILPHSRAMNGYAGPSPSRNRRPEKSTLKECARNLKKECAGRVVGPVALIVEVGAAGGGRTESRPRVEYSPSLIFALGTASQKFSAENFCSGGRILAVRAGPAPCYAHRMSIMFYRRLNLY